MKLRICVECGVEVTDRYTRKRCRPCYRRLMRALNPAPPRPSRARHPGQRALAMSIAGQNGCVLFTGMLEHGYGVIASDAARSWRLVKAYRAAYEWVIGEVPQGLDLDHACHSREASCAGGDDCIHRRCVNPHHLEPVTRAENLRRGRGPSATNARKKHCKRGHEFTPENTILRPELRADGSPRRTCRICRDAYSKSRSAKPS